MLITTTKTNFFRNKIKKKKKTLIVRKKFKTKKNLSKFLIDRKFYA